MNGPINQKEKRALWLLQKIEGWVGLPKDTFVISDMNDFNMTIDSGQILVDRSWIRENYNRQDLNEKLSVEDYNFILRNLTIFGNLIGELNGLPGVTVETWIIRGLVG
jgi:hypothetical protein